ncbi:MAG: helicase [Planctomycetes bacterium]|nr:helicase [Planctomycetota bacterium]
MTLPFVIDNQQVKAADVLNRLLAESHGCPLDIATAYFSISGYRLLREGLHGIGALRLLMGSEPESGADVGLRPNPKALLSRMRGELDREPFGEETLRLVEDLIAFLRTEKVQVRLFAEGFLHAKAYIFHRDRVGPGNYDDRLRPYAALVGSSNFTGPGLATNRELNLIHRVFDRSDEAVDAEAAHRVEYLHEDLPGQADTLLGPSGAEIDVAARRAIKSEVGGRAVMDLQRWFATQWTASTDFRDQLIDLLNTSKFGQYEYTPYQIYLKALYEYLRDQLGPEVSLFGRTAVDLTEFQADAAKKARRILSRYDGVLIADSVGLGKTWIGKKLLEDFAYHQRLKAVVVCPASLRDMWRRELAEATIAAQIVGMEEIGREGFDYRAYGDADVVLVDESHNFRNDKTNRYMGLDALIQCNGGRGRDGQRKKVILLSATPINNDLYDLLNQIHLFAQSEPDYFRDAGIGDINAYFARARRLARQEGTSAGTLLFNLLEECMVRNTRPYIRVAYPNATIGGKKVNFPDRRLKTFEYSLGQTYAGLYDGIVHDVEQLSLAPYSLESYKRKGVAVDEFEQGREVALVGIFKTRFLKRLESSIAAFRLSVQRALIFEQAYLDFLLTRRVISSRDFWNMLRLAGIDTEDEVSGDELADRLDQVEAVKEYLGKTPPVDLNQYNLRDLVRDVEADIRLLTDLHDRTAPLLAADAKLEELKGRLAGELRGQKVLIFTCYKDTARYLHTRLTGDEAKAWRKSLGDPLIRRIDSGNHPTERGAIMGAFAPVANNARVAPELEIDILISTDVLSEGQNLQDCGVLINYDLTWNPVRLVQRSGRIDRLGSPHETILVCNLFPEDELERLLGLVERLASRISQIDDLGLLDASVLGEVVHPRTFNVLRRIRSEDGAILDEEEARAELAGPEVLLKQLKELMNREGAEQVADLPDGIHSGLRRTKCHGMFFYFQAPRPSGEGMRHFWHYIDARTHEITDNRFEVAQVIACQPDEPRYIGDQDVFLLQEKVIEQILKSERAVEAKAAVSATPDPIQQSIAEEMKNAIRRATVDREKAKQTIRYLGEPAGPFAIKAMKAAYKQWGEDHQDPALLSSVSQLAEDFGKAPDGMSPAGQLRREDLNLVCFEYVSS